MVPSAEYSQRCNFNLLRKDLGQNCLQPLDYWLRHFYFLLAQLGYRPDCLDVQRGVASPLELSLLGDVISTHWDGNVTQLENALGSALGGVQNVVRRLVGLSAHDGDSQLYRKLDIIVTDLARDDVGLSVLDQVLDLLQGLW